MTTLTLETDVSIKHSDNVIMQRHQNYIEPFWKSRVCQGVFGGKDGVEICYAYAINTAATGSIVISSGRIESFIKYKELVYNLYHAGFSVFIHDHRGQGLSGRMTKNSHQGFVLDFDDYVTDLKLFYDKVVSPKSQHVPMLLCHSMGSTVGALYAHKYPADFSRVAFSAPMFGIQPALPDWLACGLMRFHLALNVFFSKRPWYFFGQQNYSEEPFQNNRLSHCPTRYELFRRAYETHPEAKLGGVTGRWLLAAHEAMREVRLKAQMFPIPALILQAGGDEIVDNSRQNEVALRMPNCNLVDIPNAKHELLMESDVYRDPALRAILNFFSDATAG